MDATTSTRRWITVAVMLALALAAFLPAALRAGFLNFDDNFYFGPDNPEFRSGFAAVLDPAHPIANAYLPVAHAALWTEWWLFGGHPFGPHLVSLLLQASVAVLFARLLLRLGVGSVAAHLAGALFAVHPALAESVSWVSGQKELLAGLFVFAALHATVGFAQRGGAWRLPLALLAAALAMYSKATAVVLPLLALLICAVSGGRRSRWALPLLLAAVVAPIALQHQRIAAAEGTLVPGGLGQRLLQVPGAFAHYLSTTLWPRGLNVLYPEVATLERFRDGWTIGLVALA
ncbi:MAG: glycosyltransferase family 39 protein, partial [Planctomycetes bacterium]|nr:glycosyltransferase family 39 protein [Planctomycetota bacterium]